MGMFDVVLPEVNLIIPKCPICKHKFNIEQEWQTKSHDRLLNYLSIKTLYNDCKSFETHTICDNCNNYIRVEFNEEQIKIKYKNKEKDVNKKYIKIYKLLRMKEKFIAQTCLEKLNESEDL